MNNQLTTTLQVDWNLLFGSMIMFVFLVGMIRIVSRELLTEHQLNPAAETNPSTPWVFIHGPVHEHEAELFAAAQRSLSSSTPRVVEAARLIIHDLGYWSDEDAIISREGSFTGKILGLGIVSRRPNVDRAIRTMHIITLASISEKEGVGKAIVNEAIRIADIVGMSEVTVIPGPGVAEFYRKLGFVHDPASQDPVGMVYYVRGQEHFQGRSLGKAEVWNLTSTDIPYYNDLMEDPDYFKRAKGVEGKIIYVSPAEYMRMTAEVHGVTPGEEYLMVEDHLVKEYAERMREGYKFPLPVVDFAAKTQEGRNRVMAAESLGEKEVPVLIVRRIGEK